MHLEMSPMLVEPVACTESEHLFFSLMSISLTAWHWKKVPFSYVFPKIFQDFRLDSPLTTC